MSEERALTEYGAVIRTVLAIAPAEGWGAIVNGEWLPLAGFATVEELKLDARDLLVVGLLPHGSEVLLVDQTDGFERYLHRGGAGAERPSCPPSAA